MGVFMVAPSFIAACIQMRSGVNMLENRDSCVALITQAVQQGATYVQTPEMTGLLDRDRGRHRAAVQPEAQDPVLAALREVARRHKITVHIGSLSILEGDKIANRAFVIAPTGDILARYDKLHLFDVTLPSGEEIRESDLCSAGDKSVCVDVPLGEGSITLGLSICYDVRFPYLYRAQALAGAKLLTAPAAFTKPTGEAHWHVLQRARAIENGAYMLSAAQGGLHADGRETFGHTLIVDPWGRVLAEGGTQPAVILAKIDLRLVDQVRQQIPSLRHGKEI
jgi:deaminated glutathione amidase